MRHRWVVYAWPGLVQILNRAEVSGLLLSLLFTVTLNFLLVTTYVWQDLAPGGLLSLLWSLLGAFWLAYVVVNARRDWQFYRLVGSVTARDLFSAANKEYLKGRFEQAREYLQRLIELNARDVEARLLLTSVALRQGRVSECDRHLRHLQRLSAAAEWSAEIRQQWRRLDRVRCGNEKEKINNHPS